MKTIILMILLSIIGAPIIAQDVNTYDLEGEIISLKNRLIFLEKYSDKSDQLIGMIKRLEIVIRIDQITEVLDPEDQNFNDFFKFLKDLKMMVENVVNQKGEWTLINTVEFDKVIEILKKQDNDKLDKELDKYFG